MSDGEAIFWMLIFLAIHFLPSFVAGARNHISTLAIFMLNLLLGWTVIGWVVALIWACTGQHKVQHD